LRAGVKSRRAKLFCRRSELVRDAQNRKGEI
jgi:hypothetical protein